MKQRLSFMKYLIAGSFLLHLQRYIDKIIGYTVRYFVYRNGQVQKNKIFIMTYDNQYDCNPKYIVDEIIRRELPVDIVWASSSGEKDAKNFPTQIRLVKRGSYSMFEEQASAKIWIDNALNCVWYEMPKKKSQVYINTWHGSMGIKRLRGNRTWMWHARNCNKKTDYCVPNSDFEEQVFRETFWKDTEFLRYGHPRNDILFASQTKQADIRKKVHEFFQLSEDIKLFLYAPTFRDDGGRCSYEIDLQSIRDSLIKRFGGEWVILVRAHFKDSQKNKRIGEPVSYVLDGTIYPDMQELMVAIESGMTDYSSWAYDFVLTRKPLFIFAPDLHEYDQMRGFYYSLESTPFPVAYSNELIMKNIQNFNEVDYQKKIDDFLRSKGCYEAGNASQMVVDKISEIIGIV